MFVESWIDIKEKVESHFLKLTAIFVIISIMTGVTDYFEENITNNIMKNTIPFIYALIYMFTIKFSLELNRDNFKIRNVFSVNLLLVFKFLMGFIIWAGVLYGAKLILKIGHGRLYYIIAAVYLCFAVLKMITMFFYIVDDEKKYNPLKAFVRNIIDTRKKNVKILFHFIMNCGILIPFFIIKDNLENILYLYYSESDYFFSLKYIVSGIGYAAVFIFINLHLAYIYKKNSKRKEEY